MKYEGTFASEEHTVLLSHKFPQTKDGYRALVWNARPAIQLDRCSLLSHVYPIPKHSAHTDVHALVQLEGTRMISSVPTAP